MSGVRLFSEIFTREDGYLQILRVLKSSLVKVPVKKVMEIGLR